MSAVSVLRASPAGSPAPSASERLLALVRARARRLALTMGRLWAEGSTSPDQGLAITAAEVDRLLAGEAGPAPRHDPQLAALGEAVAAAEADLAAEPAWSRLVAVFGLDEAEADLLAAAVALDLDPGLERVFAYLQDDARAAAPSGLLAARLAGRAPSADLSGALLRWGLAEPLAGASPWRLASSWRADPAVALSLTTGVWRDPSTEQALSVVTPAEAARLADLHDGALETIAAAADLAEIELAGPPGVGRQSLAARCAAAHEAPLLAADLAALTREGLGPYEAIRRVLRQARATGALAYFREAESASPADWRAARRLGVPFLRGVRQTAGAPVTLELSPPDTAARHALWRRLASAPAPAALDAQRLTAGQIARLAAAVEAGRPAPPMETRPDHSLLSRLPLPYDWDDLVLPPATLRQLRAMEDQVRLRWLVLEEWGFSRLTHLGAGVAALFGGPSGTGKTMAAQVLARALGLELYRVDLAGVVNKYVGETEKKLREVFDACEHAGALLFFDEADALFGGRMQVKDAHDRFANIEINYLLQRIESFDGVAILATNRRGDVDQAFLRRLRFVVEFLAPRPAERLALWRRALAERTPAGEPLLGEIDFDLLAHRVPMTGAEIKNTALAAAYLARAEGARIGMEHILLAADRELAKQGASLRLAPREGGGA